MGADVKKGKVTALGANDSLSSLHGFLDERISAGDDGAFLVTFDGRDYRTYGAGVYDRCTAVCALEDMKFAILTEASSQDGDE